MSVSSAGRKAAGSGQAAELIGTLVGTSLATQESVPAAFAVLSVIPDDPWQACLLAASLGITMAIRWIGVYRETRALKLRAAVDGVPVAAGPPERNFPLPVVIGHGVFAVTTLTIVLLIALGVGRT